jgi:hypothetical protein
MGRRGACWPSELSPSPYVVCAALLVPKPGLRRACGERATGEITARGEQIQAASSALSDDDFEALAQVLDAYGALDIDGVLGLRLGLHALDFSTGAFRAKGPAMAHENCLTHDALLLAADRGESPSGFWGDDYVLVVEVSGECEPTRRGALHQLLLALTEGWADSENESLANESLRDRGLRLLDGEVRARTLEVHCACSYKDVRRLLALAKRRRKHELVIGWSNESVGVAVAILGIKVPAG